MKNCAQRILKNTNHLQYTAEIQNEKHFNSCFFYLFLFTQTLNLLFFPFSNQNQNLQNQNKNCKIVTITQGNFHPYSNRVRLAEWSKALGNPPWWFRQNRVGSNPTPDKNILYLFFFSTQLNNHIHKILTISQTT